MAKWEKYNKYENFKILPVQYKERVFKRIKIFKQNLGRDPSQNETQTIIQKFYSDLARDLIKN